MSSAVRSRALTGLAALALAAALGGCALFPGLPPETFNLSAPASVPGRGSTDAQILVEEPVAIATYDTERIVVREGAVLSYYPLVQWADRLPVLIQTLTVETLANTGRARAAGRPGEGLSVDYALLTEVRAFEYDALTGTARVDLFVRIMDDRNGRIVATRRFQSQRLVAADSPGGVVTALDLTLQDVLSEVVVWTFDRI
ncbi:MAG: ABC-type transport auxiliary lipoprotein family protein [Bauldia sp.]